MTHLTVEKIMFEKYLFSNGKRTSQPKYDISRWKTVTSTGSLKTKNY